jgi:isochorismate synthase/2-succinyl-5-enolpyruvyl-6-hydroxy-3-cyclohexene-1-carboxylate synthase/2-succinyl-6-hydroxy-2,4-cyclohexadiene-1-carboxylate synthase/O-succinylbenzoate synthase
LDLLLQAQRGLIVVGEQLDSGAAAAALQLAALLGWPVAADVLSGLRVGSSSGSSGSSGVVMLHHMDHLLLPPSGSGSNTGWWEQLQPDVVLQVGPRVTSKRLNQFMVSLATYYDPP